jgi:pimeloyl-ACP methyl ester carboxylesterase
MNQRLIQGCCHKGPWLFCSFSENAAMKWFKRLGLFLLLLIFIYFMGPRPATPRYHRDLPVLPADAAGLEAYIKKREAAHKIKPDNEARILWFNDSVRQPTPYAMVYLHGFSASQEEGDPVHYELAQRFGIDTSAPLASFTAEGAWNSAKEALAIGKQLGKKVMLVSTSTGGTLALKLAAEFPEIAGLILLSPNIAINDPNAWLLNNPWGLQIAHLVTGRYRTASDTTPLYAQYWNNRYATRSLVQLEELVESTMRSGTFQKVTQPVLLLYYYKDEEHQDPVVKVSAMRRMFAQLGTPDSLKREIALPNVGDHVIGSYVKSKDLESVMAACGKFLTDVMGMQE